MNGVIWLFLALIIVLLALGAVVAGFRPPPDHSRAKSQAVFRVRADVDATRFFASGA